MATSSTPTESTSSTSSTSSTRAATPASGPVNYPGMTSDALPDPFALAGGRYCVAATSDPPGAIGLALVLADGFEERYVFNAINNVGANLQFSQEVSIWLLPPGTYKVVADAPFTGGNLTITPF